MLGDPAFWALVGLIIFLGLMVYVKVPEVITGALDNRADTIRTELAEARKLREEAQALLAEYQRKANEAESEAEDIIDQAKREADALTAEAKERMEEYVINRTRLAEQKISRAETQALQEVRALSADVAVAAAERLLRDRISGASADTLVSRTIDDVRAKLN
jgi:F-type H+-transporting ATPase subunit b